MTDRTCSRRHYQNRQARRRSLASTMNLSLLVSLFCLFKSAETIRYIAYYTAWATYGRNFQISNIPLDKISHINYAFANIAGGKIVLGDSFADTDKAFAGDTWDTAKQAYRGNFWQLLKVQKPKYPNLRVLISIGGKFAST
jgi:GH18 family chitinase